MLASLSETPPRGLILGPPGIKSIPRAFGLRLSAFSQKLADLLWPPRCSTCDSLGEAPFCASCAETLPPCPAGCPVCGLRGDEALLPALRPRRCANCRRAPPPFAAASAPWLHGGALAEAIHRLKYAGRSELAGQLG